MNMAPVLYVAVSCVICQEEPVTPRDREVRPAVCAARDCAPCHGEKVPALLRRDYGKDK